MINRDLKVIANIYTDFPEKFGIPRQSGIVKELRGENVYEEEFRDASALKGLEGFSLLWLLWDFSEVKNEKWRPTVRPPRHGGNKRLGVFATRSPFRPNPIGLSCVELTEIKKTADRGTVLIVKGADMLNGTPIIDIKPYLPFTDSVPNATGGFAEEVKEDKLEVIFPEKFKNIFPENKLNSLIAVLKGDPRPAYQDDPNRVYGSNFAGYCIKFKVQGNVLTVTNISQNC